MEMGVRTVGTGERERIKIRGSDRRKVTDWIRKNTAHTHGKARNVLCQKDGNGSEDCGDWRWRE
jgi:hypothetical protein